MNTEETRKISNSPLVTIGSHGRSHCSLPHVTIEQAKDEMIHSKRWLEEITQKEVSFFAWPFGHYNSELVNLASGCGYSHQLLIDYLSDEDKRDERLKRRLGNNPFISYQSQLHAFIIGKY
jgi:peptidoglycan/xylan/chitin deacetylase (PgdA/CDA1 family)